MFRPALVMALLASGAPAEAASYLATVEGVVTSQFATYFTADTARPDIKVGDKMLATFSYSTGFSSGDSAGGALGQAFEMFSSSKATFVLAGHTWTSRGDFIGGVTPPDFAAGAAAMATYRSTMDDAAGAGDLEINGFSFEIGEFGYKLYEGYGYNGVFDPSSVTVLVDGRVPGAMDQARARVSAVPEPGIWLLSIAGFGLAGSALRSRRRVANRWDGGAWSN